MFKVLTALALFCLSTSSFAQGTCADLFQEKRFYQPNDVVTYRLAYDLWGSYVVTGSHAALRRGRYGIPQVRHVVQAHYAAPEVNLVTPDILIEVKKVNQSSGGAEQVELTGRLNDVVRQIMRLRSDAYDNEVAGVFDQDRLIASQRQYMLKLVSDLDYVMKQFPLKKGAELDSDVKAGLEIIRSWFLPIPENYRPDLPRPLKPWQFGWEFFKRLPENIDSPLVRPGPSSKANSLEFGRAPIGP